MLVVCLSCARKLAITAATARPRRSQDPRGATMGAAGTITPTDGTRRQRYLPTHRRGLWRAKQNSLVAAHSNAGEGAGVLGSQRSALLRIFDELCCEKMATSSSCSQIAN